MNLTVNSMTNYKPYFGAQIRITRQDPSILTRRQLHRGVLDLSGEEVAEVKDLLDKLYNTAPNICYILSDRSFLRREYIKGKEGSFVGLMQPLNDEVRHQLLRFDMKALLSKMVNDAEKYGKSNPRGSKEWKEVYLDTKEPTDLLKHPVFLNYYS